MDLALMIAFTMSRTAFFLVEIRALYAMKDLLADVTPVRK